MQIKELKKAKPVLEADVKALRQSVEEILERVRKEQDAALAHYAKTFDQYEGPIRVSEAEVEAVKRELPADVIEGLDFAILRVTAFAEAQRAQISEFEQEMIPGVFMGHRLVPVESCAAYVPAGRYPCLTSAVMSLVPAKVVGVKRIVACSSPGKEKRINPAILYTMGAIGADEIYCLGGAQAIAAMAYGTETIQPVDLIVGPGNQYVMEAKRQVFGTVGIDFLAGPSECLVIADETARADYIAADLLAQCEHDPEARGALVTTSESLGKQVLEEIERQLRELKTEEVARRSWEDKGDVVVVPTLEDACVWANDYAPEHLEVHTNDPRTLLPLLTSYGSLFLGKAAAEVFADKVAGTNHILPTLRGARNTGGLWVGHFLKVITHQWVDERGVKVLAPYSVRQAEFETMDAHRRAALVRLTNKL
ncbi:MAG: histidinol dehydrogenase [Desulfobacteraceae bacterium]|jgi:histidinol dehydrogenase/sulfopropanediol 3-dehydrogenase